MAAMDLDGVHADSSGEDGSSSVSCNNPVDFRNRQSMNAGAVFRRSDLAASDNRGRRHL